MEGFKPNLDDENEPRATLNTPNGEQLVHRGNARLYTHLGHLACYDHAFITKEDNMGFYVFNFVGGYPELKEFMLRNDFPAYLNQTEVSQADIDAFERIVQKGANIPDTLPDDWV